MVAAVLVAGVAVFVLAGSEGARYDGWVEVDPDETVYLETDQGLLAVPIAQLTPALAAMAHRATLYEGAAPRFNRLGRAPLNRVGFNLTAGPGFGMIPRVGGGDAETGIGGHTFLGYFPVQSVGLGLNFDFSASRGILASIGPELRFLPFMYGGLYGGAAVTFGEAGGTSPGRGLDGFSLRAGLLGELPITTRLSLQLRAGLAQVRTNLGVQSSPELGLALSIY